MSVAEIVKDKLAGLGFETTTSPYGALVIEVERSCGHTTQETFATNIMEKVANEYDYEGFVLFLMDGRCAGCYAAFQRSERAKRGAATRKANAAKKAVA